MCLSLLLQCPSVWSAATSRTTSRCATASRSRCESAHSTSRSACPARNSGKRTNNTALRSLKKLPLICVWTTPISAMLWNADKRLRKFPTFCGSHLWIVTTYVQLPLLLNLLSGILHCKVSWFPTTKSRKARDLHSRDCHRARDHF